MRVAPICVSTIVFLKVFQNINELCRQILYCFQSKVVRDAVIGSRDPAGNGRDRVAVMASGEVLDRLEGTPVLAIKAPADLHGYGRDLYENLHRLDRAGAERILVELPPQSPDWAAVNDRLGRAAA